MLSVLSRLIFPVNFSSSRLASTVSSLVFQCFSSAMVAAAKPWLVKLVVRVKGVIQSFCWSYAVCSFEAPAKYGFNPRVPHLGSGM